MVRIAIWKVSPEMLRKADETAHRRGFNPRLQVGGLPDGVFILHLDCDDIDRVAWAVGWESFVGIVWREAGHKAVIGFDLLFVPLPDGRVVRRCVHVFAPCVAATLGATLDCAGCFESHGEEGIAKVSRRIYGVEESSGGEVE